MAIAQANKTFTDGLAFDPGPVNANFRSLRDFANASITQADGTKDFTGNLDMGANRIVNVPTPTVDGHLANKAYADGVVVPSSNSWTEDGSAVYANYFLNPTTFYSPKWGDPVAGATDLGSGVTLTAGAESAYGADPYLTFADTGIYLVAMELDPSAGGVFGNWRPVLSNRNAAAEFVNTYEWPGMYQGTNSSSNGSTFGYGLPIRCSGLTVITRAGSTVSFDPSTSSSSATWDGIIRIYKIGEI